MEILFISHRIPFPPDRGDKIRSHNILKRLKQLAPVHVATFAEDDYDMREEVELAMLAHSYRLVHRHKSLYVAGAEALMAQKPVSLTAFDHPALRQYIAHVLENRQIGAIVVFSGQMGQYIPDDYTGRVVMDFVDVDSAKFEAYAARKAMLARWIDTREAHLLRAEEARLACRADVSTLVTQVEAQLLRERMAADGESNAAGKVRGLSNGIDCDYFSPDQVEPEPQLAGVAGPRLIFTGQMDYLPNVEAALRMIDRILPRIRESLPEASFHVVGRSPVAELQQRHGRNGCYVWGRVADIRPWLKASDMAMIPLEIARGVQNKVLEAMAMGLPVVLSPEAARGIDAADGQEFLIGDSDDALAQAVVRVHRDGALRDALSLNAQAFTRDKMSWDAAMRDLPDIVGLPRRPALHVA